MRKQLYLMILSDVVLLGPVLLEFHGSDFLNRLVLVHYLITDQATIIYTRSPCILEV